MSNLLRVQSEPGSIENLLMEVGARGCHLGLRTLGQTELNSRMALQLPVLHPRLHGHPVPSPQCSFSQRMSSGPLPWFSERLASTDGLVYIFKYIK